MKRLLRKIKIILFKIYRKLSSFVLIRIIVNLLILTSLIYATIKLVLSFMLGWVEYKVLEKIEWLWTFFISGLHFSWKFFVLLLISDFLITKENIQSFCNFFAELSYITKFYHFKQALKEMKYVDAYLYYDIQRTIIITTILCIFILSL